jgi:hypothetical protein
MASLVLVTAVLQEQQLVARVGATMALAAAIVLAAPAAQQQQVDRHLAAVVRMALALVLLQQAVLQLVLALALVLAMVAVAQAAVAVVVRMALGVRQVAEHQGMVQQEVCQVAQQQQLATLVGRLWCVSGTLEALGALRRTCQTHHCVHRHQVRGRAHTCMCGVQQVQHVGMHTLCFPFRLVRLQLRSAMTAALWLCCSWVCRTKKRELQQHIAFVCAAVPQLAAALAPCTHIAAHARSGVHGFFVRCFSCWYLCAAGVGAALPDCRNVAGADPAVLRRWSARQAWTGELRTKMKEYFGNKSFRWAAGCTTNAAASCLLLIFAYLSILVCA